MSRGWSAAYTVRGQIAPPRAFTASGALIFDNGVSKTLGPPFMAYSRDSQRAKVKALVQQQRGNLYSSGHQNLNMALPVEAIDQIDRLKKRYNLRSRDAVVARVIAKSHATLTPEAFTLRATDGAVVLKRISPIVPNELAGYVKRIQQQFRNIPYGPLFEMMLATVGADLTIPPGLPADTIEATAVPTSDA